MRHMDETCSFALAALTPWLCPYTTLDGSDRSDNNRNSKWRHTMKRILFALAFAVVALSTPVAVHAQITGTETVTLADPSCTTAATCTAQIYRATGTCPPSGLGTLTWTELASNFAATTVTASNSTFVYPDTTAVSNSSYCYYATVTYVTGGGVSTASINFPVTTPAAVPVPPGFTSATWVN